MNKPTVFSLALLLLGIFIVIITVQSLQIFQYRIPSMAHIKTIGINVYEDANLTTPLTSINWGMLEPGLNKTQVVFIESASNTPIILFLATENWIPDNATNYLFLTWNYNGTLLNPEESIQVELTLHVSPDIEGFTSFSFDIIIGSEG